MTIPWWSTDIGERELDAVAQAFKSRRFTTGPIVAELESSIARRFDVPYVVATNSGTSALTMALLALEVGKGDEVIVPALTWVATAQAAALLGAKVVLADCLSDAPIIDPEDVKRKVSNKTKAIIPVHLNGRACDLGRLREIARNCGAKLIEDACKAMASRTVGGYLGTLGDMGCFSMGMISLASVGYGGFIVTRDHEIYEMLKLIRDHGVQRKPEAYKILGSNFKISDLLAAIGLVQIARLDERVIRVQAIYERYSSGLSSLPNIRVLNVDIATGKVPIYTELRSGDRDRIVTKLAERGVQTSKFHSALTSAPYLGEQGVLANAEAFARESFIVPSGPSQPLTNVDACIEHIHSIVSQREC